MHTHSLHSLEVKAAQEREGVLQSEINRIKQNMTTMQEGNLRAKTAAESNIQTEVSREIQATMDQLV
eukprot:7158627-Ditylum_brightwellii.AAC.1